MKEEVKTWLFDILKACSEINDFLPEQKDFNEFKKDIKTKRAIERNIEIVGEAMSRIVNIDIGIKISDSRKIVDARNRIIHGYDTVSDEIIWGIALKSIPVLQKKLNHCLKKSK